MPALYTSEISWRSAKLKKDAAEYAKKHSTNISAIVQEHFRDLLSREKK